jgi:hypothetical protein
MFSPLLPRKGHEGVRPVHKVGYKFYYVVSSLRRFDEARPLIYDWGKNRGCRAQAGLLGLLRPPERQPHNRAKLWRLVHHPSDQETVHLCPQNPPDAGI